MDCSPPGSSVHGLSQARILEWVAGSCSFSTQGSNPCLLRWQVDFSLLHHQGSPSVNWYCLINEHFLDGLMAVPSLHVTDLLLTRALPWGAGPPTHQQIRIRGSPSGAVSQYSEWRGKRVLGAEGGREALEELASSGQPAKKGGSGELGKGRVDGGPAGAWFLRRGRGPLQSRGGPFPRCIQGWRKARGGLASGWSQPMRGGPRSEKRPTVAWGSAIHHRLYHGSSAIAARPSRVPRAGLAHSHRIQPHNMHVGTTTVNPVCGEEFAVCRR